MMTQTDFTAMTLKDLKAMRREHRNVVIGEEDVSCTRCGGAGGWKGWPGFTCYRCMGSTVETVNVYDEDRNAIADQIDNELYARSVVRADKRRAKAIAASDPEASMVCAIVMSWWRGVTKDDVDANGLYLQDGFDPRHASDWWERKEAELAFKITEIGFDLIKAKAKPLTEKQAAFVMSLADQIVNLKAKRIESEELAAATKHVGTIGEKITVEATLTFTKVIQGHYGSKLLMNFKDADGNCLVWWNSGSKFWDIEQGAKVTLTGTVKDHGDYNGTKQTTLLRCRLEA